MNEIERAGVIRGFKALALLLVVLIMFVNLWPLGGELFHLALVILCLAAAAPFKKNLRRSFGLWKYRKRRSRQAVKDSSTPPTSKPASLFERYRETIEASKSRVSLSGYDNDNLIRDCIRDIAEHEGRTDIAPGREYLSKWERRSDIPDEYRRLVEQLRTDFDKRAEKLRKTLRSRSIF